MSSIARDVYITSRAKNSGYRAAAVRASVSARRRSVQRGAYVQRLAEFDGRLGRAAAGSDDVPGVYDE